LSTALALIEAGATVAVYEAGRVCSGVTAYTTAKVSSLHGLKYAGLSSNRDEDTARQYAEANQAGLARVAHWVDLYGIDCDFERRAACTYTTDADRVKDVEAEVAAATDAGLDAVFVESDPDLPFPIRAAVRLEDQAQFHPRRYCLGLARAIVERGGAIHEHTRVVDIDGLGGAEHVVLATHLPFLDRGGFFAKTHPERSYALAVRLAESGAAAPSAMYLSADAPTRSLRTAGEFLIVGGEGHKVGHEADTRHRYDALRTWASEHFDVADVAYQWSAQDYVAVDGTPFVGRMVPGSNVFVATGFGKWGMANGTAAALMIADAIGGVADVKWSAFDATRLRDPLTSRAMYQENIDAVAGHLALDRLKTLSPPPATSLAPGEGGIVDLQGEKVAGFVDDAGALHAVSPVCTHLGCLVGFNTAERTWDCPCHGSRYTVDGAVIQGPAVRDLDVKTTRPSG
jgi:glycine/D-amino acid oxidase-like deaminating enzyme/nitrite reductase/ring-hydroxylating ferredoxin subunit